MITGWTLVRTHPVTGLSRLTFDSGIKRSQHVIDRRAQGWHRVWLRNLFIELLAVMWLALCLDFDHLRPLGVCFKLI